MVLMIKLLITIIQTKRVKTKLLLLCLVLTFLFKTKNLLLNAPIQVLILNQVHLHRHHHHHHLLYHNVSVQMMMNAVIIESDQSQSLGIAPHLVLSLQLQVMNLLVVVIMNHVHILVDRRRNSTSIIMVIDISKHLQHLKFRINNNPVLCLLYQTSILPIILDKDLVHIQPLKVTHTYPPTITKRNIIIILGPSLMVGIHLIHSIPAAIKPIMVLPLPILHKEGILCQVILIQDLDKHLIRLLIVHPTMPMLIYPTLIIHCRQWSIIIISLALLWGTVILDFYNTINLINICSLHLLINKDILRSFMHHHPLFTNHVPIRHLL
mmetsp:Transcript_2792/g.3052  ORF Transcript_2792/g.3052 Transcript_2792/m.3052 type:complete len:323 (+) Transcript_2792:239-1207(+)